MHDLDGEVIAGRYKLLEFLNDGAFGYVYKAEQPALGSNTPTLLAVKILKDDLGDEHEVLREVLALKQCDHENIVRFHEAGRHHVGRAAGRFFIAMELADESLHACLTTAKLSVEQVVDIARQLCEGLQYLHARKLVHRDIKPANVLRVGDRWKLSDFGLARQEGHLQTQSRLGGTPAYAPPEGLSDILHPSFDMWSLGYLLHECLTGRRPDRRGERAIIDEDLPAAMSALISGCLLQDPERRWTAEKCLQHLDPTATPVHHDPRTDLGGCFLCEPGNDCRTPWFTGLVGDIRKTPNGYACKVYATDELEPVTLLLTETWAKLGDRLQGVWKQLTEREQGLTISAFHVFAHDKGLRADDNSLVVLDPDWLVNVTDLSHVNYCERIQLTRRYTASRSHAAVTAGNVVHELFPQIWNRGLENDPAGERERKLGKRVRELAQIRGGVDFEQLREDIDAHVNRLRAWANSRPRTKVLNTESYVIAPRLGLKGRIDALWFDGDTPVILGELKTGKPDDKDMLQIISYGLMLVSRNEAEMTIPTILVNPRIKEVRHPIHLSQPVFRRVMELRNYVLLLEHTVDAPYNEAHCKDCFPGEKDACVLLTRLRSHNDTRSIDVRRKLASKVEHLGEAERTFYRRYEAEIIDELRAVKSAAAWLWSRSCEEREREGLAMRFTTIMSDGKADDRHVYQLIAGKGANYSNFKADERVILSGADGPVKGRLATATIAEATADGLVVRCESELTVTSGWVSADVEENLIKREFAALFQWIIRPGEQRDVIVHGRTPTFGSLARDWRAPEGVNLNLQQRTAVEMSVRARDYLLVVGPPGAGKTTLLRAMIEAQLAMGRRILVSAGTNRAVDQVVRKLIEGGLESKVVRMGQPNSMASDIRNCALEALYDSAHPVEKQVAAIRQACTSRPVTAATASFLARGDADDLLGKYDIVILDEATQLSVPATLGPLRFAKRFVLVGDPNQLPPVRTARDSSAPTDDRADSLFELLAARIKKAGADGLIELENQYRMNAPICTIPSRMWYSETLRPGTDGVAKARLSLDASPLQGALLDILDPKRSVVFVDVPPDFSKGYRLNLNEAHWAARIVAAVHASDHVLRDPERADGRLGVLAPFRAQVACIRRALEEHLPQVATRHWVDTVDRFQGDERDLMIFSLVGGRNWHVPELLNDPRRLNVALSRARHKLILIGDHGHLSRTPLFKDLFEVMALAEPNYIIRPSDLVVEGV